MIDSGSISLPCRARTHCGYCPRTRLGRVRATAAVIPTFLCPSDGMGGTLHNHGSSGRLFARGNYAGFFGNRDYGTAYGRRTSTVAHEPAAFGFNVGVRIADISDGTSSTMAFGEILTGTGSDGDHRGVHWYDHVATSQIFTKFPPNTPSPDIMSWWCLDGGPNNQPARNLPCQAGDNQSLMWDTAASRSRHPGGVQVVLCDGSVHFITQDVDVNVWQAMGSIAGKNDVAIGQLP